MFAYRMQILQEFHKPTINKLVNTTIIDLANAPELSDEELYSTYVVEKDKAIFANLFRKYMALVFGVCMKYEREKHAAQDSTMEIFERLLQHQPERPIRNLKAFIYVVSKNHCLMKQRGEKIITLDFSDADMENAMKVHPIDMGEQELQEELLKKCLKKLKDLQKDCVQHFYIHKKSYQEISRELKVTLNAVKSHIQNGKRNLKICIEGEQ